MPKSVKGWGWLCLLLAAMLVPSLSKAQDLSECQAAAKLAYMLTLGVTEGYKLENLQVNFPRSAPEVQEANQRWAQAIKDKMTPLLPPTLPQAHTPEAEALAQSIGRQLAEDCAFALGALRRTASSEALENPRLQKDRMCIAKANAALWAIQMRNKGVREEDFFEHYPVPEHWSPDLKDWAVWMVKEAYRWPRGVEDFGKWIYQECWR